MYFKTASMIFFPEAAPSRRIGNLDMLFGMDVQDAIGQLKEEKEKIEHVLAVLEQMQNEGAIRPIRELKAEKEKIERAISELEQMQN
jgi:hypothetical protein